jgi:pyridoxamine 5'-phosphate oxidase
MSAHTELLSEPLPAEPLTLAQAWLGEAWRDRRQPNPNAMVLATSSRDGHPSARVVLCKDIQPTPGFVAFYTNYESRKGRELAANARAAVVMHWDHLERQVRIEGRVVKAPAEDSDAYFASRALESRIGAWASQQSQPLTTRQQLLDAVDAAARRMGVDESVRDSTGGKVPQVPRPPHWGGYRIWADAVELWVAGAARIHDRARWTRTLTPRGDSHFDTGPWTGTRLQP